jgi:hypothetical protein
LLELRLDNKQDIKSSGNVLTSHKMPRFLFGSGTRSTTMEINSSNGTIQAARKTV